MGEATALVMTEPGRLESQTFPIPVPGLDDGVLRVEATGICGSDYHQFLGELPGIGAVTPVIPGHEIVGRVEAAGADALVRWGVSIGDLVVVHEVVTTESPLLIYGITAPTTREPSLWGGYASHVYLHPDVQLHRVPDGVDAESAALFVPIANGIRWGATVPGTGPGDTVAIFGPGQQGLGCVIGAHRAGAARIVVIGLASDRHRLEIARELGATDTVIVGTDDPVERVMALTGGAGADIVVDASAGATEPLIQGIAMARSVGTIILGGLKNGATIPGFVSDHVVLRQLRLQGVGGHDHASVEAALEVIASGAYPLDRLRTHTFPLRDAEHAIRVVGREIPGEDPVHVTLIP